MIMQRDVLNKTEESTKDKKEKQVSFLHSVEECVGIAFPLTICKPVESFLDQLLSLYLEQQICQEPFWADR